MLVKIGGAVLEEPDSRAAFARSVARAIRAGHEVVLVHGGGKQLGDLCRRVGIEERRWKGLRITDADVAELALCVLAGSVNRLAVRALELAGVHAIGLSGADGGLFGAAPLESDEVDLGYVGQVNRVDPTVVQHLLAGRITPVVCTVGPRADADDAGEPFYNVNADHAAGALARALEADALLLMTDVPALLDGNKQRVRSATLDRIAELEREGVIAGGMIPKVQGALQALAAPSRTLVKIVPGAGDNAVLDALSSEVGTVVLPDGQVVGRG
jgi:acetylglutamate kinase